jgi:V/A-type H+-transporting ATPase subunit A
VSEARIFQIGGPVLRARSEGPFRLREAVQVGEQALLGEVVSLNGPEIVAQVYEDTTGLRPGDRVLGTGAPLGIRLGPGLLGNIFDGLLRPLSDTSMAYVLPGMRQAPAKVFPFVPAVRQGDALTPGMPFGRAALAGDRSHLCLVPPGVEGEVAEIAAAGDYADDLPLCHLLTADGQVRELAMSHFWPVRQPRPIAGRLPGEQPLHTGQRILDCLFPVARGSRAAIPGGFGTGKTILLENLAKWCNADVIVYVGCGERGNEIAGVLEEFPALEDPRSGRPLMDRTVIIANTSNMPVSAREVSIYSAATVAEYFRDQGLHVALMADSTSRWAEALREVSGRLGELPGEGGYPAYLSSRLAEFYERAAEARTLGGGEGSVTLIGAISPPSADFSEPVTSHTKRYVKTFWALDTKRAQARLFPAINPLQSYTEDADGLARWWREQGSPSWLDLRRRFLTLLEEQARLERMARIIGKESLPPRQRLTLLCADLINESFLRQSAFSEVDRFASPARQTAMMHLLGRFIDLAEERAAAGVSPERIARMEVFRRLQRMGEEIGEDGLERFKELEAELEQEVAGLSEGEKE